ncbi:hypothetical protein GCM10012275_15440 [Longimycelium tulufanense]|uniref:Uncharacterized protein n=1 Tax=Longimycelium tulufanense TaxID=907463 RepID=A0A8J3FT27_9PSEU|nr:hypothetical protein [Longimycelium tulufanense]GGM45311.1 hypothetical protein GCM10012275_15440 [Longimycelium tulufanense]
MRNVSTPAAFAVEWVAGESENLYQLINSRGTTSLFFGIQRKDTGEWRTMSVLDPSRYMDKPPKSFHEFEKVARSYIEA